MTEVAVIAVRREPGPFTRSLTALILRTALGVSFLFFGIGKFNQMKAGTYPDGMIAQFDSTWLGESFPWAVKLFAQALPYVEVGVGALLIAGLATTVAAAVAGIVLVKLMIGLLVLSNTDPSMIAKVTTHFLYVLTAAATVWLSPVTSNYISLDGLLFGWFWKPKTEGTFLREPSR